MILIADSGSTKTDWRILRSNQSSESAKTLGVNPYYQTPQQIRQNLFLETLSQQASQVKEIFFYGAGCSVEENKQIIKEILQAQFPKASVSVNHDLLAAARALCQRKPGIACILGTGSNACLYDGETISEHIVNLGYILGDEGSGAYFGKKILVSFLYKDLPTALWQRFRETYQTNRDEVMDNLYKKPFPNRYLATFTPFLLDNIHEPFCRELLQTGFTDFLEKHVKKISDHQTYLVHFTGAIAYHYQEVLKEAMTKTGLHQGQILESPIDGLVKYHYPAL